MEIKKTTKQTIYFNEVETSLKNLMEGIGNKPDQIMQDIKDKNLEITGPPVWVYEGCDGDPDTVFKLKMAWPVNDDAKPEKNIEVLEPITVASAIHKGSYANLKQSYEALMHDFEKQGYKLQTQSREIYYEMGAPDSPNNITEIQVAVEKA